MLKYLDLIPQPMKLTQSHWEALRAWVKEKGWSDFSCPVITVAGTNGKGSTVALIESLLLAGGYRVGAYTSPHLLEITERIRIQGQPVEESVLAETLEKWIPWAEFASTKNCHSSDIPPFEEGGRGGISFFQAMTLAALKLFHEASLDVVILEVGIGGRLDPVNIVDADIAVITSIDIDHVDWLGTTREAIGKEKAGIFREYQQVVYGDRNPPASVLAEAARLQVRWYGIGKAFDFEIPMVPSFTKNCFGLGDGIPSSGVHPCTVSSEGTPSPLLGNFYCHSPAWTWFNDQCRLEQLPLPSLLLQNAAIALQVTALLSDRLPLSRSAIETGLRQVSLPGRLQRIPGQIEHVFDMAHNPAAGECLARALDAMPLVGRTFAVCGMLSDKDHAGTLLPLQNHIARWFLGDLEGPRGMTAERLAETLTGKDVQTFPNVLTAYRTALAEARPGDRIVVFGSFRTVAAVMGEKEYEYA